MSENTKIEWATHTFNPWIGCTKVGPGCDNCYAKADFDDRKHRVSWGAGQPRSRTSESNWNLPIRWNNKAAIAQHAWAIGVELHSGDEAACIAAGYIKPERPKVFCASLADVFDNEVPVVWRMDLFQLIAETPNLDWLILTKRIGNVMPMCSGDGMMFDLICDRVWLGATIVNQEEADRDIPKLLATPAHKRFLSMEPLLGPVYIRDWLHDSSCRLAGECVCYEPREVHVDWVIVGGESGPCARPMSIQWARELRDQCTEAGVPFLFKQWGEWGPAKVRPSEMPGKFAFGDYQHERTRFVQTCFYPRAFTAFGARCIVEKVGKKAAGRMLDGRTWDGAPS
jgi:protein gp37